jgi:hypothetical protein
VRFKSLGALRQTISVAKSFLFRSLWTARWQGLQFLNWHNHGLPPNHFHQGEHARGMARVREIHNRSLHLKFARRGYEDAFRIGQKNIVD